MLNRWVVIFGCLLLGLAPSGASVAKAAIHCVRPGGGAGCFATIPLALAAANDADTIRVAAGAYIGALTIIENVTLEGGWNSTFTTRDPSNFVSTIIPGVGDQSSVVSISGPFGNPAASTPVVDGFTITGGRADLGGNHGGGIRIVDSQATIRNSVIIANQGSLLGGGIWVQRGAPLFESLLIENNVVVESGSGGGVHLEGASATFTDTVIRGNRVEPQGLGGGIAVPCCSAQPVTVRITGGSIENNRAGVPAPGNDCPGEGGAIYSDGNALLDPAVELFLDAVVVKENCGDFGGGGLDLMRTRYVVTNSLFVPPANSFSPAIDASLSEGHVRNSTFVGVNDFRAIRTGPALTLTNSIIRGFETGVDYSHNVVNELDATFNDFFGNVTNLKVNNVVTALDSSNLLVDPLLDGSFHLTSPSPAIDAGMRTDGPFRDIDGDPRPMAVLSSRYKMDIGADEFAGTPQLVTDLDLENADLTIIGPGNPPENAASVGTNDWIGYSVLGGDVNADGLADLLISAEDWAEDFDTLNATGRVFGLFHFGSPVTGTIDLAVTREDLTVVSEIELQHIGERLLVADLNADGEGDLIIAAANNHQMQAPYPSVFVLFGDSSLAGPVTLANAADADFALIAPEIEDLAFATRNALAVGDLNGDQVEDLVVGDARADDGATANTGAAFVVFGGPGLGGVRDLATTAADFTLYGPALGAGLGSPDDDTSAGAVAVGLIDGDSQPDLIARTTTTAYVRLGPLPSGVQHLSSTAADITVSGLAGGGMLVMDLTGDGTSDLLLESGPNLFVIPGPLVAGQHLVASTAAVVTLTGGNSDNRMRTGDLLGDARPDLIIGLPKPANGVVYVVAGGLTASGSVPLDEVADRVVLGPAQNFLGFDVGAGDLDGNGRSDLIVGSFGIQDPSAATPEFADVGKTFVFYSPEPGFALMWRAALLGLVTCAALKRQSAGSIRLPVSRAR